MSVVVPHRAIEIVSNSRDPKQAIFDTVGDLSGVDVIGDQVLIGIYIRPEKTAGGIIRPTVNVQEDVWQGKVGLVLKWGPDAFRDPEDGILYEQRVEIGEWGVFKIGDTMSLNINNYPCRLVRSNTLRLKVKNPNIVF